MIKKCPKCESIAGVYEDYVGGTSYYRCQTCGYWGSDFELPTVFDQITTSPDVLTEKLVYKTIKIAVNRVTYSCWKSTITEEDYSTEAEAIAATLIKLKEVAK